METIAPGGEAELAEAVREAADAGRRLEIVGGGSRAGLGRPVEADAVLSTAGLSGITAYEPGALTIVVKAGTKLAEVEAALAAENQCLAFEPMDHRALYGTAGTEPTVGGMVAAAASGPRRILAGACRDAILGVRFVSGAGDIVKNGGRVMKNVTGYDLAKLMCGAHGTLGVITEVAFKVQPVAAADLTVAVEGLSCADGIAALSAALTSPFSVTGAAHLPAGLDGDAALTILRVEGMERQAGYRAGRVAELLAVFGNVRRIDGEAHRGLWQGMRDAMALAARGGAIWRVALRPSDAPKLAEVVRERLAGEICYDWGGGLAWLRVADSGDAGARVIRETIARLGGHATLIRAPEATRSSVEVFSPEPDPLARISAGLRERFDPRGILNPGRMRAA